MLTLSRFIVGMGMAGEYACASTYAVESWPKHLKSKASAFLVSGFGIGNIIAAYFMPSFAEAYGWRAAFFCRFATRSFSNLHPAGLLNLKSGKKLNSVVPESIHKVPGQFSLCQ